MKEEFEDFYRNIKEGRLRFSQRAYIFLFCLLLSTFFWFLSALSDSYTTYLKVPLRYTSLSDNFVLEKEPPKQLSIKVRSSGFELLGEQISLDRNTIDLDLSKAKDNRRKAYFILSEDFRKQVRESLDPDIELIEISPDSIFLETQERLFKEVPVRHSAAISVAKGYGLRDQAQLVPDRVKLSGPRSFIDTLSFVETERITLENLTDSTQLSLELKDFPQVRGVQMAQSTVKLNVAVEKFTEKSLQLKIIPNNREGTLKLRTFPPEVKGIFLVPISKYEDLDASLMRATVRLDSATNSAKLAVKLENLPDYAKLIRLEPSFVEYIITE